LQHYTIFGRKQRYDLLPFATNEPNKTKSNPTKTKTKNKMKTNPTKTKNEKQNQNQNTKKKRYDILPILQPMKTNETNETRVEIQPMKTN
jgi:hypothetical protein